MDKILLHEYEEICLGNRRNFSNYFFSGSKYKEEKTALSIIRYAIEERLHWTPNEMKEYFNKDIAKLLHLEEVIKHIEFPPELNPEKDFYYLAHKLYPKRTNSEYKGRDGKKESGIDFNEKELVVKTYQKIMAAQMNPNSKPKGVDAVLYEELLKKPEYLEMFNKGETLPKFPKEYMDGNDGLIKSCVCFQFMLKEFFIFHSVKEMYEHFASPKGITDLRVYRLYPLSITFFDTPIDYLHESLPSSQKNEFYYHYYKFQKLFKTLEKEK